MLSAVGGGACANLPADALSRLIAAPEGTKPNGGSSRCACRRARHTCRAMLLSGASLLHVLSPGLYGHRRMMRRSSRPVFWERSRSWRALEPCDCVHHTVPANANLQFLSACVPGGSWRCMSSRSTLTVRGWAGCVCVQSRASCELPGTMPGTMRAKAHPN